MAEPLPPGDYLTRCPDPRCGAPMVVRDPQLGARVRCECGARGVVATAGVYAVGLDLVSEEGRGDG